MTDKQKALLTLNTTTKKNRKKEVVKSGTTDMYQPFLTAHGNETALRDKQGKNGPPEPIKINEMNADFRGRRHVCQN
jgi:hypothetical protein